MHFNQGKLSPQMEYSRDESDQSNQKIRFRFSASTQYNLYNREYIHSSFPITQTVLEYYEFLVSWRLYQR